MGKPICLIYGITGMDGGNLSRLMLSLNYEVHGVVRRKSENFPYERLHDIEDQLHLHTGDLTDQISIFELIKELQPEKLFNLAAQSNVWDSSKLPVQTAEINALGHIYILEAVRQLSPHTRVYFAGTSEQYGNFLDKFGEVVLDEQSSMNPVSPYGFSKNFAFGMGQHYRKAYDLFIANGILFNHSGYSRGDSFFEKKIANHALDIANGNKNCIKVGNLKSKRDIGASVDYVRGMNMMLDHSTPDDFVLATGETHTMQEIAEKIFSKCGLDFNQYVQIDESLFRPEELNHLCGCADKAKTILGWEPRWTLDDIINDLVFNNPRYNEKNLLVSKLK